LKEVDLIETKCYLRLIILKLAAYLQGFDAVVIIDACRLMCFCIGFSGGLQLLARFHSMG
jgi:hypothetical protein